MKKVFIGVLAVMMLVAFTACEQPTIKYPANVSYITIEQTGDFIEGQTFKASNFAVYAHDTNGDSTVVPGANVTLSTENVNKLEAGETYTAHAELKVAGEAGNLTADLDFTAYAIESYTFTGVPALVAYVGADDYVYAAPAEAMTNAEYAAAIKAMSVSVTYNGSETMELSLTTADKTELIGQLCVVKENGLKATKADFKVGTTYALGIGATTNVIPGVATNLTATGVANAPVEVGAVSDVEVVYIRDGEEITLNASTGNDTLFAGDVIAVQVWTVDAEGNRIAQLNASDLKVLNGATLSSSYTVSKTTGVDVDFLYTYKDADSKDVVVDGNVTISASTTTYNRSVENIGLAQNVTVNPGKTSFNVSDFQGAVTLSDGTSSTKTLTANEIELVAGQSVPSTYTGTTFTVYMYTKTGRDSAKTLTPVTVAVTPATTPGGQG